MNMKYRSARRPRSVLDEVIKSEDLCDGNWKGQELRTPDAGTQTEHPARGILVHTLSFKDKSFLRQKVCSDVAGLFHWHRPRTHGATLTIRLCHCRAVHGGTVLLTAEIHHLLAPQRRSTEEIQYPYSPRMGKERVWLPGNQTNQERGLQASVLPGGRSRSLATVRHPVRNQTISSCQWEPYKRPSFPLPATHPGCNGCHH